MHGVFAFTVFFNNSELRFSFRLGSSLIFQFLSISLSVFLFSLSLSLARLGFHSLSHFIAPFFFLLSLSYLIFVATCICIFPEFRGGSRGAVQPGL
jgi:hypothetical protein